MIKVDLITGFLGSGKTTFITGYAKYLVGQGKKIGIIENDYGAVNVDMLLLTEALKELPEGSCRLEMVIGSDPDCHRRRLKTKLIAMAMLGLDTVLVEPSGIFDVDEFFDILYEEPLDRWYQIGNVIALTDAGLEKPLSEESEYILVSQISKAGALVLTREDQVSREKLEETRSYIDSCLEKYKLRPHSHVIPLSLPEITDEDYKSITSCGYRSDDHIKLGVAEENDFTSLFFFHVKTPVERLETTIREIFEDKTCGQVFRIKGFIKDKEGWLELNATRDQVSIKPVKTGQELFIVIGEKLIQDQVGKHWDSYLNEYVSEPR